MIASAVYIFNDYQDIKVDRQHPKKQYRPLAAATIPLYSAFILMLFLMAMGLISMALINQQGMLITLIYLLLNIVYSLSLKHIAILDVTSIALGFVLRLFVGSAVTGIVLSMWMVIITFLLTLFIALAKRRDDILILLKTGKKSRKVLDGYNLAFIDSVMNIMASIVILSYILYTILIGESQRLHHDYLYSTSLFVVLGMMRYLQIIFVEENSGSPIRVSLQDRFIQITIICWLLSFVWMLYL